MPVAELPACVFCGEPIGPGEETAGRAPMAAHVRCADAALADDSHWDAISSGSADEADEAEDEPSRATSARRGGCLGAAALIIALVAAAALGLLA